MIQQVSHRPIKCQSRSWRQRCTTVKGSHHGDSPLLKPTGIQIATKAMPGATNREHRRFIDVKKVSLFGYELQFLLSGQKFELQPYREDCLMCCPTNKVIKSDTKCFYSSRRVTRRQGMRYFTGNDTYQCRNGPSNLFTPCREQFRSTRILVAYPRPAISATKREIYAPISFDQQAQVSLGHISYRKKENINTAVHSGGGLELEKPARGPVSTRRKPCASLKKPRASCPFAAPCLPS